MNDNYVLLKSGFYRKINTKHYFKKVKCLNCGCELFRSADQLKKYAKTFCTKKCQFSYGQKFDIVINNNFAYLIGLIATDGHITWPGCTPSCWGYLCRISLQKNDMGLLENIKKIFGGKAYFLGNMATWGVNDIQLIEYLRDKVGLTNNKCLTLDIKNWYDELSDTHKFHFWRGVIDGDGSIIAKKKGGRICICSASRLFAELIAKEFNCKIHI